MSDRNQQDTESADAAINRVLQREREAHEVIEQCRREAQALLGAARQRAQRLRERVDARVVAVHRISDQRVERDLAAIAAEPARAPPAKLSDAGLGLLDAAVERLLDEMVGGTQ